MTIIKHNDEANDDMVLKPDLNITFKNKSSIKRSEESGILLEDEQAIAMLEGDISNDNASSGMAVLYAKTKLQADISITYPDHASLKKHVVFIPVIAKYAAAAIILLMISLGAWFIFNPAVGPNHSQYELLTLERISPDIENQITQDIKIEYRVTENMQMGAVPREMMQLGRLEGQSSNQITIPSTLTPSYAVLHARPSNPSSTLRTGTQDMALNEEPKKKTMMGKIFSGIFSRSQSSSGNDYPEAKPGTSENFSLWSIAKLGIKGVNALGDHDYTVVRNYNDKGKVKGVMVLDE